MATIINYEIGYSNPAVKGHNGAETDMIMEVFREKLADSPLHYDQSDQSSKVITFDDLEDGNGIHLTEYGTAKIDIETLVPDLDFFTNKVKRNGWRKNRDSI